MFSTPAAVGGVGGVGGSAAFAAAAPAHAMASTFGRPSQQQHQQQHQQQRPATVLGGASGGSSFTAMTAMRGNGNGSSGNSNGRLHHHGGNSSSRKHTHKHKHRHMHTGGVGGPLPRCQSAQTLSRSPCTEDEPITLPNASDPTLRGDGKACALPALAEGASHAELRCITPATMVEVMDGNFTGGNGNGNGNGNLEKFVIVDCRYPFEYEGGHIEGAVNLWTQPMLEQFLLERHESTRDGPATALIFHCEFSSHRGPKALRHIRNVDRGIHLATYPALFFPEMYILDGGYKRFFNEFPKRCTPESYILMLDQRFDKHHTEAQREVKRTRDRSRQHKNPVIAQLRMAVEHAAAGMGSAMGTALGN